MIPVSGFDVVGVEDGHCFAARTPDGTMSWCLDVEPRDRHSRRLTSRWRAVAHHAFSAVWIAPPDPGAFIVEPRRLLTIKARAEQATRPGLAHRR
jgi:hypothetical protein